MFESLLKRIKKLAFDIRCCCKSSCTVETKDCNGETTLDQPA